MSWDLAVFSPDTQMTVDEDGKAVFPDGFEPKVLGDRRDLQEQISAILPETDWTDPTWGYLDRGGYSVEFSISADGPIRNFMIFARGNATPVVSELVAKTGWVVFDTATGAWFNLATDPEEGWRQFESYRRTVLSRSSDASKPPSLWQRLKRHVFERDR